MMLEDMENWQLNQRIMRAMYFGKWLIAVCNLASTFPFDNFKNN